MYDERWRPVATFREDDSDPKEQFVYHAPGNDGFGGAGYIDDVILRDRDADTDWDVQADGTLEERIYYCQNWRHDVVALIDADGGGQQLEQIRYEAYGVPHLFFAGDVDADGSVETADVTTIQGWIDTFAYNVRGDVDLDGDVDATDKSTVQNAVGVRGGGRGVLTANTGNRKAYAGYEYDNTITHASYHVRHRVLNSTLGQWLSRTDDIPSGLYHHYEYSDSNPMHRRAQDTSCNACNQALTELASDGTYLNLIGNIAFVCPSCTPQIICEPDPQAQGCGVNKGFTTPPQGAGCPTITICCGGHPQTKAGYKGTILHELVHYYDTCGAWTRPQSWSNCDFCVFTEMRAHMVDSDCAGLTGHAKCRCASREGQRSCRLNGSCADGNESGASSAKVFNCVCSGSAGEPWTEPPPGPPIPIYPRPHVLAKASN